MTHRQPDRLRALLHEAQDFAGRIDRTLAGVLHDYEPVEIDPLRSQKGALVECVGTQLTRDAEPVMTLVIKYFCDWSSTQDYLAITKSRVGVKPVGGGVPLVGFDYLRYPRSSPAAHINFSGMSKTITEHIPAPYDPEHIHADDHTSNMIHLPTGGHRFRATLEDVLEMLVRSFDIDVKETWQQAVQEGRQEFRKRQLAAAVADDPQTALEQLRKMDDHQLVRTDRLQAF